MEWGSLTWLLQASVGARPAAMVHHGREAAEVGLVRMSSLLDTQAPLAFATSSGLSINCVVQTGRHTPCLAAGGRENVGLAVPLF